MGEIFDAPLDKTLNHAAIVELVHNASLVADDAFDGDTERRGSSTLWSVLGRLPLGGFGERVATGATIMAENGLVALAFELVEDPDVARALGRGLRKLVDGFFQEGSNVFDGVLTGGYDKYIEINRAKTGGLFALASWMSATYTDAPEEQEDAARKYGESLGILYQIADDIGDDDLPSYIQDPSEELQKWYDETIGYIDLLPDHPSNAYLHTAPSWMVYKMLDQEDALDGIDVSFIPEQGAE
jgi:geranylgeranyl pyrophosphate synthase